VIPIVASVLVGVAAKLGVGAVVAAAKRIFSSSAPSSSTPAADANQPRRPFAEELERARAIEPGPPRAAAAPAMVPAPAAIGAPSGAPQPRIDAPRLANDPARMAITARAGRRRAGALGHRLGRHQLGAYRRMDLGPR
jgi:hypothetical protein